MPSPRKTLAVIVAVLLLAGAASAQFFDLFVGAVPTITVAELPRSPDPAHASLAADGKPLLLVDLRSAQETAVSMIPGAITREAYERDADRYADYRIVPYCTVGARSRRYTQTLREAGIDAVNFEGSILGWVEDGRPVVTPAGDRTVRVHTWSAAFDVPPGYEQVTN